MALVFGEGGGGVGSSFKPAGATLSGVIARAAGAVSGAGAAAQAAVQAAGTKAQQVGVSGTPVEGSPNLLWVDTPSGGYYYDKNTGYRWQNGAWYSPQGYQWVDDGVGGHFRDPSSGLIWKDGLWVDPAKQQVFIGGQWQSPRCLASSLQKMRSCRISCRALLRLSGTSTASVSSRRCVLLPQYGIHWQRR